MKIKPLYIYMIGILVVFAVIIILSVGENTDETQQAISNSEMPNDYIHKGMMGDGTTPSSSNVMSNVKERMDKLENEINENPADTAKMSEYASMLAAAHKPDKALEYYKKILEVNPKRIDILMAMTFINHKMQKFDEAERLTNIVLEIDKSNLNAKYNLGVISATKGNREKARSIWEELSNQTNDLRIAELAKNSLQKLK